MQPNSGTPAEATQLRALMQSFLDSRRDDKLDKLKPEDPDRDKKRDQLLVQFQRETWIEDAARRVSQIQLVTHLVKAIHPSAKGNSLFAPPESLPRHGLVGTHQLGERYDSDVVGNAAALDVYKFLRLEHDGKTLLSRAIASEPSLIAAFSDDIEEAQAWAESFATITRPRGEPASHALAKQLYFPLEDGGYHLLAPLYPTSLIHRVSSVIRDHRFGEDAKAARKARRENQYSPQGTHDYPQMAMQKLGGTKPQNISQLNSERYGDNYLLASLPPNWQLQGTKAPLNIDTAFKWFRRRREVWQLVRHLKRYLASLPAHRNTLEIRDTRSTHARALCDELLQFAAEFRLLKPGWSEHEDCLLPEAEKYWLDPYRAEYDQVFAERRNTMKWQADISDHFGAWLNDTLKTSRLPMADPEYSAWRRELKKELRLIEEEVHYAG